VTLVGGDDVAPGAELYGALGDWVAVPDAVAVAGGVPSQAKDPAAAALSISCS
jgi:hypothetical protein